MNALKAFCMCMGMYTAIPIPWRPWDEKLKPLMLAFLPVVGLLIGGIWFLCASLARVLLPHFLSTFVMTAVPYLLTGFMHLDGFMDTVDAVRSWRALEERRHILKDVHCGAFAVVGAMLLMVGMFAACADLESDMRALALIPAASRCMSVIAVNALPPIQHSQFAQNTRNDMLTFCALFLLVILLIAGGLWIGGQSILVLIAVILAYALSMGRAFSSLKGISGDLAGYALSLSELAGIAVLAILTQ